MTEAERRAEFEAFLERSLDLRLDLSLDGVLQLLREHHNVHWSPSGRPIFRSAESTAEFLVWTKRRFLLLQRAFGGPMYVLRLGREGERTRVRGYFRGLFVAVPYGSGWGPTKWLGRRVQMDPDDRAHARALVAFLGSLLMPHETDGGHSPFRAPPVGDDSR